jgi:hypothetical protein
MTLRPSRRTAVIASIAAVLVIGAAFAPSASASNVAWGVSVGGPGFVVSAGQPGYWHGYRGYGYGYYRPWHRPFAPIVYAPPPVVYPYAYAPRPVYVAPRPVYVPRVAAYYYGR